MNSTESTVISTGVIHQRTKSNLLSPQSQSQQPHHQRQISQSTRQYKTNLSPQQLQQILQMSSANSKSHQIASAAIPISPISPINIHSTNITHRRNTSNQNQIRSPNSDTRYQQQQHQLQQQQQQQQQQRSNESQYPHHIISPQRGSRLAAVAESAHAYANKIPLSINPDINIRSPQHQHQRAPSRQFAPAPSNNTTIPSSSSHDPIISPVSEIRISDGDNDVLRHSSDSSTNHTRNRSKRINNVIRVEMSSSDDESPSPALVVPKTTATFNPRSPVAAPSSTAYSLSPQQAARFNAILNPTTSTTVSTVASSPLSNTHQPLHRQYDIEMRTLKPTSPRQMNDNHNSSGASIAQQLAAVHQLHHRGSINSPIPPHPVTNNNSHTNINPASTGFSFKSPTPIGGGLASGLMYRRASQPNLPVNSPKALQEKGLAHNLHLNLMSPGATVASSSSSSHNQQQHRSSFLSPSSSTFSFTSPPPARGSIISGTTIISGLTVPHLAMSASPSLPPPNYAQNQPHQTTIAATTNRRGFAGVLSPVIVPPLPLHTTDDDSSNNTVEATPTASPVFHYGDQSPFSPGAPGTSPSPFSPSSGYHHSSHHLVGGASFSRAFAGASGTGSGSNHTGASVLAYAGPGVRGTGAGSALARRLSVMRLQQEGMHPPPLMPSSREHSGSNSMSNTPYSGTSNASSTASTPRSASDAATYHHQVNFTSEDGTTSIVQATSSNSNTNETPSTTAATGIPVPTLPPKRLSARAGYLAAREAAATAQAQATAIAALNPSQAAAMIAATAPVTTSPTAEQLAMYSAARKSIIQHPLQLIPSHLLRHPYNQNSGTGVDGRISPSPSPSPSPQASPSATDAIDFSSPGGYNYDNSTTNNNSQHQHHNYPSIPLSPNLLNLMGAEWGPVRSPQPQQQRLRANSVSFGIVEKIVRRTQIPTGSMSAEPPQISSTTPIVSNSSTTAAATSSMPASMPLSDHSGSISARKRGPSNTVSPTSTNTNTRGSISSAAATSTATAATTAASSITRIRSPRILSPPSVQPVPVFGTVPGTIQPHHQHQLSEDSQQPIEQQPSVAASSSLKRSSVYANAMSRSHARSASMYSSGPAHTVTGVDATIVAAGATISDNKSSASDTTENEIDPSSLPLHARSSSALPMISNYPFTPHRLFDNFLVLGCSPTPANLSRNLTEWIEKPKVLLKFPHHSVIESGGDVAEFAFPSGVKLTRVDLSHSNSFGGLHHILYGQNQFIRGNGCHTFLLKTSENIARKHESENLYGVVVQAIEIASLLDAQGRNHEIRCPVSYCLLSRFPFFELHQKVIHQILMMLHLKRVKSLARVNELTHRPAGYDHGKQNITKSPSSATSSRSTSNTPSSIADPTSPVNASVMLSKLRGKPLGPHQVPDCVKLLKSFYDIPLPSKGGGLIKLPAPKQLLPIEYQRTSSSGISRETSQLIAQWNCALAWSLMAGPESLVDLLEVLLREWHIIVVEENLALLSAAVMSCAPLLHPLVWSGVFLPILPNRMHEFLEAPVPILVGVTSLPQHLALGGGTIPQGEEDTLIWFPGTNKMIFPKSFKRLLPHRAQLISMLRPHFNELRRLFPIPNNNNIASKNNAPIISSSNSNNVNYSPSEEEQAHVKIILHLIETEVVARINEVRIDFDQSPQSTSTSRNGNTTNNSSSSSSLNNNNNNNNSNQQPSHQRIDPLLAAFRETQMLSHYLQYHELDEDDY